MNRRSFLLTTAAFGLTAPNRAAAASAPLKEVRIGYQKTAVLLVVKARKQLEKRFEPQGVSVRWVEFAFGPPLLEALSAGAVDYGYTGDAPPIFAQAAHAAIRYVGVIPARGDSQAVVVPKDSPICSIAELKGKRVAVAKGSSAHNLLVAATESAGSGMERLLPGVSRSRRRGERLCARGGGRLVDLGPLLRHCRARSRTPGPCPSIRTSAGRTASSSPTPIS